MCKLSFYYSVLKVAIGLNIVLSSLFLQTIKKGNKMSPFLHSIKEQSKFYSTSVILLITTGSSGTSPCPP